LNALVMIRRLPLPIPWPAGPINVLLVEDDPLTLIDTGPNFESTLGDLEQALDGLGYRLEDIERVLLTHQHIDHTGLASEIVRRSGAELWGLDLLADWMANQPARVEAERRYLDTLLQRHGVPAGAAGRRAQDIAGPGWDPTVTLTRTLRDGDELPFATGAWRVMTRPGHSPFDTVFLDERRRILIVGDHLLPLISSNAVITAVHPEAIDAASLEDRPRPLIAYRDSLRRTRDIDVDTVLPGHGPPILNHRALIDRRLAEIDARTERIAGLLAGGPRTAHEVARDIWPKAALTQPDLTLSEVLGHADVLRDAGRLTERDEGRVVKLELMEAA
jgi:glyoxylase-like metal-dependent hydrolase (beta-lactamase superfamily II)